MQLLSFGVAFGSAFLFFCANSVDPKGKAFVRVGSPFGLSVLQGPYPDPTYRFFSKSALLWTIAVLGLVAYTPGHCSVNPTSMRSLEAVLGCVSIWVIGKILLGPMMDVRKTVRLVGERLFEHKLIDAVIDAAKTWPMNILNKIGLKAMVLIVAAATWLIGRVFDLHWNDALPMPVAIAWILACMGRTAAFILFQKPPHGIQVLLYLATLG